MTHNYIIDDFDIYTNYIDNEKINIKIIDKKTSKTYERINNFHIFLLQYPENDIYTIISNCFSKKENHNVILSINETKITCLFQLKLSSYNIHFSAILYEIGKNKTKIEELEEKIKYLEEHINVLENKLYSQIDYCHMNFASIEQKINLHR